MQLPNDFINCVTFLGVSDNKGHIQPKGTGFFVSKPLHQQSYQPEYLVTAGHNIEQAQNRNLDSISIRLNLRVGGAIWVDLPLGAFRRHPDHSNGIECIDVAVAPIQIDDAEFDQAAIPLDWLATKESMEEDNVSLGDEIAISGLFRNHIGTQRNEAIIRVGNICAMPLDKVETKLGKMWAYLVEARSIGGISGSPVFLYMEALRARTLRNESGRHTQTFTQAENWKMFSCLGLVHGHYDLEYLSVDSFPNDEKLNMGVAIVVPSIKIIETINQPYFLEEEKKEMEKMREKLLPTMDSIADKESE